MNYAPFVNIIVPVYNARGTIGNVLKRLLSQDYPSNRYEVIVVDDGSTDGGDNIVRQFPVTLIQQPHQGAACARNKGLREARGEIIILLDGDCLVRTDWIKLHVKEHQYHKGEGCVGGAFGFPLKGTNFLELCDYYSCWYEQHPLCPPSRDYEYLPSTNLSFSPDTLKKVGGFTEELQTGEDVDLCRRLVNEGKKIIFRPRIVIDHYGRRNFKDFLRHHYRWGKHAPSVRRYGSKRRFHFLFRPSIAWSVFLAAPIAVGYTIYIAGRWLRFIPLRIIPFLPMIFIAKIAYASGVVKGTMELNKVSQR